MYIFSFLKFYTTTSIRILNIFDWKHKFITDGGHHGRVHDSNAHMFSRTNFVFMSDSPIN